MSVPRSGASRQLRSVVASTRLRSEVIRIQDSRSFEQRREAVQGPTWRHACGALAFMFDIRDRVRRVFQVDVVLPLFGSSLGQVLVSSAEIICAAVCGPRIYEACCQ